MTEQEEFEFRRRLEQEQQAPAEGRRSRRDQANQYAGKNVGDMGALMRGVGGAKVAFDRAAMGLKGLFTDLTPEDKVLLEQGNAFEEEGGAAAKVGSIGADVGMSLAPGAFVTKATAAAPLLARTAAQLGLGAGYGALTSPEDRSGGATAGALGTAAGMGVNRLVGGVVKPFVQPEAKALMAQGVQPTIGQAVGGAVNQTEQKLKSLPLVGDVIRNARGRAVDEFNTAVGNRALSEIGEKVAPGIKAGSALNEEVASRLGAAFDRFEPSAKFVKDVDFTNAVASIRSELSQMAPDKLTQFDNIVQNQIADKLRNGAMTGEQWGGTREMLNRIARQNKLGNPSGDQIALSDAIRELQQAVTDNVVKNSPANIRADLLNASAGWRQYKQMEKAAGYKGAMNNNGVFTPSQYVSAVRGTQTASQRAQGKGTNAEFAQQAQKVLGDTVPDSGTATRLGWMLGAGAVGGGAAMGVDPASMGAAALMTVPLYSRGGAKFMTEGFEPLYKKAVQTLALRGVPTQTVDEILRKYGPQGVVALARGQALNMD